MNSCPYCGSLDLTVAVDGYSHCCSCLARFLPQEYETVESVIESLENQMPPLANLSEADRRWLHTVGWAAA